MRHFRALVIGSFCLMLAGCCSHLDAGRAKRTSGAQLFRGMGTHHRAITTTSKKAQEYFDQGLIWMYAFNHDEAIRSFKETARLDPNSAMAWWGVALCHGPNINDAVVPPAREKKAWDALQKAIALKRHASSVERDLIDALSKRYADPQPSDRRPLDEAYAAAMRKLWNEYPADTDIGTLFAESLMDLRPWDLWSNEGEARPETTEVLAVLDGVLTLDPKNPGANHLYIHTVEASPMPNLGLASASRLEEAVPGSGHLLHMPSHIYVLTGNWDKASIQNEKAIASDRAYRRIAPEPGFYRLYMIHNHHMLSFASMMEGRSEVSIRAASDAVNGVPEESLREYAPLFDGFMGAKYDALKRFGRWDEILKQSPPPAYLPITTAMWRFSRAVAFAALGKVEEARKEEIAFEMAAGEVPEDAMMAINPARKILEIARHFLKGEILFREGQVDSAVAELTKSVVLEDQLIYMEPPEWMQPSRHTLGVFLLAAKRYAEAEMVYREDLKKWRGNGWSLYGLSRALQGQGKTQEAATYQAKFRTAWSRADTPIASSCLCVPTT